MGGIIVKEALAYAHDGDGSYGMIPTMTYGLVFFGVPHRGSEQAMWGQTVARILRLELNNSFSQSVASASKYNDGLRKRFEPLLERYRYISIGETLPEYPCLGPVG